MMRNTFLQKIAHYETIRLDSSHDSRAEQHLVSHGMCNSDGRHVYHNLLP